MADPDSRLFKENEKGDLHALQEILRGRSDKDKIMAVSRIIAAMTSGADVSRAFMDVVNNIQTKNLELKKLIYLYVMSYAKLRPELAISVVNTFQKDSQNPNPLIRALAIRTMASIRVSTVVEHLCEPLARTLADEDAYVRKTAAIAVAKLHDMDHNIVADHGFLDTLRALLEDANPMVVSNALIALLEIQATSPEPVFAVNTATLNKLLGALGECSEWGQVAILDGVAAMARAEPREAESVIERVVPYLSHSNSAVTLAAVRVIVKFLDALPPASEFARALVKRLGQPLASLLNSSESPPESQYVALRSIALLVQRFPALFTSLQQIRLLFCNYNDPIYVKLEKVEILVRVATEANVDSLLVEFKTYAQEVDVEFVRKAVRAIGRCAIKLELATQRCVDVLLELIETKVNYVVQEAIVVIRDIFRKYPGRYEVVIGLLCDNLEELDEPEAKAAMIWIVGEYAERIDNAAELLESFLETYADEVVDVQLALLTAIVKLFLKRPAETQTMVHTVLNLVTQTAEDPDLRDRGFLYWRLLAVSPEAAKSVVLAARPLISDDTGRLDPTLLATLLGQLGTLSAVYYLPPATFVVHTRIAGHEDELDEDGGGASAAAPSARIDLSQLTGPDSATGAVAAGAGGGGATAGLAPAPAPTPAPAPAPAPVNLLDLGTPSAPASAAVAPTGVSGLIDMLATGNKPSASAPTPATAATAASGNLLDLLGARPTASPAAAAAAAAATTTTAAPVQPYAPAMTVVLEAGAAKGLEVSTAIRRVGSAIGMQFTLQNRAMDPVSDVQIAFNKNSFGLVPAGPLGLAPLAPNGIASAVMPVAVGTEMQLCEPLMNLQVALKCSHGLYFFALLVPFGVVLVEGGRLERAELLTSWRAVPETQELAVDLPLGAAPLTMARLKAAVEANHIFVIAEHSGRTANQTLVFVCAKTTNGIVVMSELAVSIDSASGLVSAVRCSSRAVHAMVLPSYHVFMASLVAAL